MKRDTEHRYQHGFRDMLALLLRLDEDRRDAEGYKLFKLGSHNIYKANIVLYAVETKPEILAELRQELDKAGISYRLLVETPGETVSNIQLLDIGI